MKMQCARRLLAMSVVLGMVASATIQLHAQELKRVKTGDRLGYELLTHGTRGREIYVASVRPITAEVTVSGDGKTITYSTGRIEKFDRENAVVERTLTNRTFTFDGLKVFRWLPADPAARNGYKVKWIFSSQECGEIQHEFDASAKDAGYKLTVEGKETDVRAVEYWLDGKWMSNRCGTGKQTVRVLFAPDLDLILENDFLNYLPNGFLNVGNGIRLKSIN